MKTCSKCKLTKGFDEFHRNITTHDKLAPSCKVCRNADRARYSKANREKELARRKEYRDNNQEIILSYRQANKEREAPIRKKWADANKDKMKAYAKAHYEANREEYAAKSKAYRQANPAVNNANSANYRARKAQRTPLWADLAKIKQYYEEAQRLTELTGITFHVDHVIPLRGKKVSGLNVHNNLDVIPFYENVRKSNSFDVE